MRCRRTGEDVRPVLRWAGSKSKLIPRLSALIPHIDGRYVEPFAGSACLFFALRPQRALLADINVELVDFYSTVAAHPVRTYQRFASFPKTATFYYRIRSNNPRSLDAVERAARFLYLNRYCFNAVYRTNSSGDFNVPRGYRQGRPPTAIEVRRASFYLRKATIKCSDFEAIVAETKKGDFIYLDPPYASTTSGYPGEYGRNCFTCGDIPRLLSSLERAHAKGVRFLLSYAQVRDFTNYLRMTTYKRVLVRRYVAAKPAFRARRAELLLTNGDLFG